MFLNLLLKLKMFYIHHLCYLDFHKCGFDIVDRFGDSLWTATNSNRRMLPDYNQLEKLFCYRDASMEENNEVML